MAFCWLDMAKDKAGSAAVGVKAKISKKSSESLIVAQRAQLDFYLGEIRVLHSGLRLEYNSME